MAVGAILVTAVDAEGDRQSRPQTEYRLLGEEGIFNRAVCMTRLEVGSVVTVMKKPNQIEPNAMKCARFQSLIGFEIMPPQELPMKVYFHTHDPDEGEKEKPKKLHFARIPVVGECIVLSNTVHWYKVVLVLHTPYMAADADAEVWCVKITRSAALKASGYSPS